METMTNGKRDGRGLTKADAAIREAYAREIATAEMTTRELAAKITAKFGRAPHAYTLRDVLKATGREMRKRPDITSEMMAKAVGEADARRAYAEKIATATMTVEELRAALVRKFGMAMDETKLRATLRAKGGLGPPMPRVVRGDKTPGGQMGTIGSAARVAYAKSIATPDMSARDLGALVAKRFGIGLSNPIARDVLAEVRPLGFGRGPAHTEARKTWARAAASPGMTAIELMMKVQEHFGIQIDLVACRRILRESGAPIPTRKQLPPAPDLQAVNRALEKTHAPVLTDAGDLEAGIRATIEKLAAQMKRAHMTKFAIDIIEGTYDAEWAKRVTGRLTMGEK